MKPMLAVGSVPSPAPGNGVPLEDRQRVFEIVAVTIIKREAGKRLEIGRSQAGGQIVQPDEPIAAAPERLDRLFEKVRGDFQMRIGIEGAFAPGADMMQGEDRPAPPRRGSITRITSP